MWRAKYPTPEICNVAASVSPIGARYVMTTSSPGTSRLTQRPWSLFSMDVMGPFTQVSSNLDSGVEKYNSAPAGTWNASKYTFTPTAPSARTVKVHTS